MSDIIRPEGDGHQNQEVGDVTDVTARPIPHSGNLGLERPIHDDGTSLEMAATRGLETPEHPGSLTSQPVTQTDTLVTDTEDKKNRNKIAMFVGGGALALLAAGAGFLAGRDNGTESPRTIDPADEVTPSTQEILPEDEVIVVTPSTEVAPPIEGSGATVRVADALIPSEEFITATRANGQEIRVPKLRDTSDLNAFGESALALMACYLSTGSQECLDEFTTSDAVKEVMADYRQNVVVEPYAEYTDMASHGNFQMVIYDEASTPAEFTRSDEFGYIVSSGGPVYFQISDADDWQGLVSSSDWYGQVTDQLEFRTEEQPDGTTDIIGMRFHLNLR
ncbi:hypothetical protein H0X10_02835 [Candidatus Saccharibacteria bacterium]|nr:hypothetical protein [Candidatus Saccharibacteria bacterium]